VTGTAKFQKHFTSMKGTLIFCETDFRKTVGIPIVNDNQYEPNRYSLCSETVTVQLWAIH
jgi:hypothetical protein